jgi:hypothetical protein
VNFSDRWIAVTAEKLANWPIDTVHDASPRQVFLDADCSIFALVSAADYQWAIQWRWKWNWDRTKTKRYAIRTPRRARTDGSNRSVTVYLHKEILGRSKKKQPTELHTIGDHQNGESLDCQIENLEWATRSMNRRNRRR